MKRYMIFHGDADGLMSACQIVKEWDAIDMKGLPPPEFQYISGGKMEVDLVNKVSDKIEKYSEAYILDLSSKTNRKGLVKLKEKHVGIDLTDHHEPAEDLESILYRHSKATVNTEKPNNTSSLINDSYKNEYAEWAIVGALGDSKVETAEKIAKLVGIEDISNYKTVADILNYNSFTLDFRPEALLEKFKHMNSPIDFLKSEEGIKLMNCYESAYKELGNIEPVYSDSMNIYILPDTAAARALFALKANEVQMKEGAKTHLVLVPSEKGYDMSIRAPEKAYEIAKKFGGGGREQAAGASIPKVEDPVKYVLKHVK